MRARAWLLAGMAALAAAGCVSESAVVNGYGYYDNYIYYGDNWYWNGCCVDPPDVIGPPSPPHPEHPIANPPDARPSNPIASPPATRPSNPIASPSPRPTPMPRPAMRGGGGRR
jgi:hypothetical protein